MRSHSPFIVDVRELLENPGTRRDVVIEAPLDGVGDEFVKIDGDARADLVLEAIDGGLLAQGRISGLVRTACSRCLRPIDLPFDVKGSELYRPAGQEWDEEYTIGNDLSVDLEVMARDTVVPDLPRNLLCREDCKGLCAQCGTDLNEGSCDCRPPADPRWSALQQLKGEHNG